MQMRCNNCQTENVETNKFCYFCGYQLQSLVVPKVASAASSQLNERKTFMNVENLLPMVVITVFILLSVFLTKDFVYSDSSTQNIDSNQSIKIAGLKKVDYNGFLLNLPEGYEVVDKRSYLTMLSATKAVQISLSLQEGSYSLLKRNTKIISDHYEKENIKLKSIEIKNIEYEHIFLTAENARGAEYYEIYAKYDNDKMWHIIVNSLFHKTVSELDIADSLLVVLGVSK